MADPRSRGGGAVGGNSRLCPSTLSPDSTWFSQSHIFLYFDVTMQVIKYFSLINDVPGTM